MAPRPCIVCGTPATGARCPAHPNSAPRPGTTARGLGRAHQRIARFIIARHVDAYGWMCPGYGREPHLVAPGALTADHIIPRSVRPDLALEPSNYTALCRPCNSRKGGRNRTREKGAQRDAERPFWA